MEKKTLASTDILRLNVGGRSFGLTSETCRRLPPSCLLYRLACSDAKPMSTIDIGGCCDRRNLLLLPDTNEYFFDRSPQLFELVFSYCLTGRLHCPPDVCPNMLENELYFWGFYNASVEACCSQSVHRNDGVLAKTVQQKVPFKPTGFWSQLWQITEDPKSSRAAKVFAVLSVFFICVSVANLVLGTLPTLQDADCLFDSDPSDGNATWTTINEVNMTGGVIDDTATATAAAAAASGTVAAGRSGSVAGKRAKFKNWCVSAPLVIDVIESVCIAWFTIELILRLLASPDKLAFVRQPLNVIDFLATGPFFVEIALQSFATNFRQFETVDDILAVLKVLRVCRVLKLARYFLSLRVFGETLAKSLHELGVLAVFVCISVIIFSSLIYYVEKDEPDTNYVSIPASFWWCVVTLTTVGFGDVTPTTVAGKIIGGVVCVTGILLLAFPVSILTEHFMAAYKKQPDNGQMSDEVRQWCSASPLAISPAEYHSAKTDTKSSSPSSPIVCNGRITVLGQHRTAAYDNLAFVEKF